MKTGKMMYALLAVCIVFALAACGTGSTSSAESGRQTASAYLDQSENAVVEVTVDLTGGWSVEFARGAVYLYDGEITEGKESVGMLITLDQEVYDEDMAAAEADKDRKEADGGVYYAYYEDEGAYLTSLDDSAYILITANKADIEAVVSRFAVTLDQ